MTQMIKSELIAAIAGKQIHLLQKDVELAVNSILDTLTAHLANGERIEIRGFGGFSIVHYQARLGRNPKSGDSVHIPERRSVHFKPGLDLRNKINDSRANYIIIKDL
jgi:integration host factor subunit beta